MPAPEIEHSDSLESASVRLTLLERENVYFRQSQDEIRAALKEISASLSLLARLEERDMEKTAAMERAFKAIEKQETRLRNIEKELPLIQQVRKWVFGAAGMSLAAIGAVVLAVLEVFKGQ